MHLEFMYKGSSIVPPTLEEVLKAYADHWVSEAYKDEETEEKKKREGAELIKRYYEKHVGSYRPAWGVEKRAYVAIDPEDPKRVVAAEKNLLEAGFVHILGFMDRVDEDEDGGGLSIVDYKTGGADPARQAEASKRQMILYCWALPIIAGKEVRSLWIHQVSKGKEYEIDLPSAEEREASAVDYIKASDEVEAARRKGPDGFPTNVGEECKWCDYKVQFCPAFKADYGHLREKGTAEDAGPQEMLPGTDGDADVAGSPKKLDSRLGKLVDKFAALKAEIHDLEAKADKLKGEIVQVMQKQKYVKAFGERFQVVLSEKEAWDFSTQNKPLVLEAIKSAGYWDRVLGPLAGKVQELMRDENVPMSLRSRIQKLGKKTVHPTVRIRKLEEQE